MKFVNNLSMRCECCEGSLLACRITTNPHHLFSIGQLYTCTCGLSSVWANSIRNEPHLLQFLATGQVRLFQRDGTVGLVLPYYRDGFCNDRFCNVHLANTVGVLKNDYKEIHFTRGGERFVRTEDLLGCELPTCCNRHILYRPFLNDPETAQTEKKQIEWYRDRLADWIGLVDLEILHARVPPHVLQEIAVYLKSRGIKEDVLWTST